MRGTIACVVVTVVVLLSFVQIIISSSGMVLIIQMNIISPRAISSNYEPIREEDIPRIIVKQSGLRLKESPEAPDVDNEVVTPSNSATAVNNQLEEGNVSSRPRTRFEESASSPLSAVAQARKENSDSSVTATAGVVTMEAHEEKAATVSVEHKPHKGVAEEVVDAKEEDFSLVVADTSKEELEKEPENSNTEKESSTSTAGENPVQQHDEEKATNQQEQSPQEEKIPIKEIPNHSRDSSSSIGKLRGATSDI